MKGIQDHQRLLEQLHLSRRFAYVILLRLALERAEHPARHAYCTEGDDLSSTCLCCSLFHSRGAPAVHAVLQPRQAGL